MLINRLVPAGSEHDPLERPPRPANPNRLPDPDMPIGPDYDDPTRGFIPPHLDRYYEPNPYQRIVVWALAPVPT